MKTFITRLSLQSHLTRTMTQFVVALATIVWFVPANAQTPQVLPPSEIYKAVVKSTVSIVANNGNQGSGFYVAPNVIVTNWHVIAGASEAIAETPNTGQKVEVMGILAVDREIDLVLLQVSGAAQTPLRFARKEVEVGENIYAIGTPQGFSGTISDGLVSATRHVEDQRWLQISAPISHGSSGCPVVNRFGEVVGIATLMHSGGQNLNFAVHYSHIQSLMRNMSQTPQALGFRSKANAQATSSLYEMKQRALANRR